MRLQGKTALVTGSTSGIGQAIAEAFAREGARVVITGRNSQRGQAVVDGIRVAGGQATFLAADQASVQEVRRLAAEAIEALGHIDILVNNAGIFPLAATEQTDEAIFDATIAINVKGPFYLTAALAPQMAQRGSGKVINITSVSAHIGMAGSAIYGATKAALTLLTRTWAAEFGPKGVNVNAISPGLTRNTGAASTQERLDINQLVSRLPARRAALPAEIAEAAVYLASDEANFVHGVTLPVDGGRTAI
jgi:NAD(P)-dependent dehydrogenase (short-subunit alcohol dehydrogenase family)